MTKPSRQRKWQLIRIQKGLCAQCGKEPLVTKTHGEACRKKHNLTCRDRARVKFGFTRRFTKVREL